MTKKLLKAQRLLLEEAEECRRLQRVARQDRRQPQGQPQRQWCLSLLLPSLPLLLLFLLETQRSHLFGHRMKRKS